MLLRYAVLSLAVLFSATCALAAQQNLPAEGWQTWKHLPVFHRGRLMPMDTFARSAVEIICNRTQPTFDLKASVTQAEFNHSALAEARTLFPDDKPRRFDAAELLFSWLVEPEKWEDVPFLIAEHDKLRELLDVPVTNHEGKHLKYVSPRQVLEADAFQMRLQELAEQQRMDEAAGKPFQPESVDKKIGELFEAYQLYREISFSPNVDHVGRQSFQEHYERVSGLWPMLDQNLEMFSQAGEQTGLSAPLNQIRGAMQQLDALAERPSFGFDEAEPPLVQLETATAVLARDFSGFHQKFRDAPPADWDADRVLQTRLILAQLARGAVLMKDSVQRLHGSIYENGDPLRVVPALDAVALDRDRDAETTAHPWLDLQTLLFAPTSVLADYPEEEVQSVRQAFQRVAGAYLNPEFHDQFALKMQGLAESLRKLAVKVEPSRRDLPNADPDYLAYTTYPAPDHTQAEVRYNTLDPFKWSWVISLGALCCFALSFGVLRRPMFWIGMAVLGLCLLWTLHGFYLRVSVTRWAPVTNMYETVVYVPLVVALLGAWFALLPVLWPGVKRAWQLTAIPGTWEAPRAPSEVFQFSLVNLLLLVARAAAMCLVFKILALAPYAAGDRTIINLLPVVDVGSSLPDGMKLLTWAVGLCVLIPAVWYLPRVMLTALVSVITVPLSLVGKLETIMPQIYPRRAFVLAATIAATGGWLVAWWAPILDESFTPLQPVLRDNFWLTIHVLTIVSSYAAGTLAWWLGNIALFYYLFGSYRPAMVPSALAEGHRPGDLDAFQAASLGRRPPEQCATLASYIYKAIQVAVLLLAAGTILGGLWADVSWGRFWGWDPKEVWALISLLTYLAILHGRYAGLFGNFGLAVGSVLGASAIIFSWYGVNFVLGAGLHSYGFGQGGQWEVFTCMFLNWAFLAAACVRYVMETRSADEGPPVLPPPELIVSES